MSEKNKQQPLQHYSRPQMSQRQDPNLRGHSASGRKREKGSKHTGLWVSLIIIVILVISVGPLINSQVNRNSRQDLASPKVVKKRNKRAKQTSSTAKKAKTHKAKAKPKPAQTGAGQTAAKTPANHTQTGPAATSNHASQAPAQTSANNTGQHGAPSTYTVKAGDSLSSIASQYGLTVDQLTQQNNLTSADAIQPGQTLKLK